MKKNKLYIVLWVVVGILILIGASYLGRSITDSQNKAKEGLNVPNDFTLNGNTCHNRSNYFVVTRADLSGSRGDDILIKYKVGESNKIKCEYLKNDGDFELLNTPIDAPSISQHFLSLNDNLLVVDEGNGTIHSFTIYNLDKREKVFSDTYSAESFDLQDSTLTYWHKTNDIPNKLNCSKVDEYNKSGGAQIEAKMSFDVSNPKDREINEFRCTSLE